MIKETRRKDGQWKGRWQGAALTEYGAAVGAWDDHHWGVRARLMKHKTQNTAAATRGGERTHI